MGLLAALDRFVTGDDAADIARLEARLMAIAAALNGHKVTLVPEILEEMDAYVHRQLK